MRRFVYLLPALALAGCGGDKEPVPTHPVTGQVIYDGKPATGVQVYFFPTSAPTVPAIPSNPHGVTAADGRFALTTYRPDDGAPEGGYQVVLLWPPEAREEDDKDRLLGWYDAVHSRLSAQVAAKDNAIPPYRLPAVSRPPGAAKGVPGRN